MDDVRCGCGAERVRVRTVCLAFPFLSGQRTPQRLTNHRWMKRKGRSHGEADRRRRSSPGISEPRAWLRKRRVCIWLHPLPLPPLSFCRCALVEFHPLILSPRSREEALSPPVLCGLSSDTAFLRVRCRPSALLPGGADGEAGSQSDWAL